MQKGKKKKKHITQAPGNSGISVNAVRLSCFVAGIHSWYGQYGFILFYFLTKYLLSNL